jgi:anti-sigma regulatory factor (Ser/Thr protein kinase)
VLLEAERSHPSLATNGVRYESSEYRGLEEIAAPFAEPLCQPPGQPASRVFQAGTLAALRAFVREGAADAGFSAEPTEDLVLAVDELASNSVLYGGGGGILRTWEDGDARICEVSDTGVIEDPLVGRKRPGPDQTGGYGVWLANQLCDLVQVRSFAGGSAVRVHKNRC